MGTVTSMVKQSLETARKPIFRFVTPPGSEAVGYWRMGMPYVGVHKLGFYGNLLPELPTPKELGMMDRSEYKTLAIVTHLTYLKGTLEKMRPLYEMGVKLVVDVDDYVWRWDKITAADKKLFNQTLAFADVVTTTTPYLQKKIYEHCGRKAYIVPNTIPEEEFRPPVVRQPDERLRVIYTGGIHHTTEWPALRDMIEATSDFADWVLFHGQQKDKTGNFMSLVTPPELMGVKNILWQIPQETRSFLKTAYNTRPHVAVAPLAFSFMNNAKSDLKLLEAGALGIPCIAQCMPPYEAWELQASSVADFVDILRGMDTDEAYRTRMGEKMVDYAWARRLQTAAYLGHLLGAYQNILETR